ncbi:MAG: peptidoglycan editing factor PgeF [Candidatus Aminicenantales bacterium]
MNAPAAPSFLTVPRLSRIPWLVHGFGTRLWALEDFGKRAPWKDFKVVRLKQTHSDDVHFIDDQPRRRLLGDALATGEPEILLVVKTADCLPVFLVDEGARVVAAVHAGWRGTRRRILERAVQGLWDRRGSSPQSLLAALGPCIGASCYEVGEDVRRSYLEAGLDGDLFRPISGAASEPKYLLDLKEANRRQLIGRGLRPENIFDVALCTHCDRRLLSFRRDRDRTARLYNFIGMTR